MSEFHPYTMRDFAECSHQMIGKPSRITGVGRMKFRPFCKVEADRKKKKRRARKIAKQSRKRNRR